MSDNPPPPPNPGASRCSELNPRVGGGEMLAVGRGHSSPFLGHPIPGLAPVTGALPRACSSSKSDFDHTLVLLLIMVQI